ncbi:uncharacterized protein LOC121977889 [Zingiber officinale]|uniref:Uncharacterized protein n=1 Tax=Zingiber officinale TaxID=94328 RepID=A0A8J5GZE8_ZINOF|nr:uncharacterized protein LOC121977889 [Zingiber officinale]XP_042386229.1 uncharacterized protein LOC121977889 [Zingiber officinale]KAG6511989.1 hypothetical protein ZIOFF_030078 [Zingiber officinale]
MWRSLALRTLIRSAAAFTPSCSAFLPSRPASCLDVVRFRSDTSAKALVFEVDLDPEGGSGPSEIEVLRRHRIVDELMHFMVVSQFAPDWLPFVPGGSFWVPSQKPRPHVSEVITSFEHVSSEDWKLRKPLSKEEELSFTTERGWPSSAYFFEGPSSSQAKRPQKSAEPQTDDEDN